LMISNAFYRKCFSLYLVVVFLSAPSSVNAQSVYEPTAQAAELNKRGEEFLNNRAYAEAAKQFRKALAIDPNYEVALRNLGTAQEALGKDELAAGTLQKAIKIAPDDAIALNGLGHAYFHQNKYQESADAYKKAIAIHDSYPEPWNGLGAALLKLGKT